MGYLEIICVFNIYIEISIRNATYTTVWIFGVSTLLARLDCMMARRRVSPNIGCGEVDEGNIERSTILVQSMISVSYFLD